jgi:hypothetical protein
VVCEEFLDWLRDCLLVKKDSAATCKMATIGCGQAVYNEMRVYRLCMMKLQSKTQLC